MQYDIKHKTGDKVFLECRVNLIEIINGKVYYQLDRIEQIIPQEMIIDLNNCDN